MDEVVKKYSTLTQKQQTCFLLEISHLITILARETYSDDDRLDSSARVYNELLHKLLGQLNALNDNRDRYTDEVFVKVWFSMAEEIGITSSILKVLDKHVIKGLHWGQFE